MMWSNRRWFAGLVAVGLTVAAAGCGGDDDDAASGNWSFTDDRGVTVTRDEQPERIVAYDLAAAALMNVGVPLVGIMASEPLAGHRQLEGLDLSGVTAVAESYGAISLEKLASLNPDVVVTIVDPRLTGPLVGFPDQATQDKVEQIAPIIAINSTGDLTGVIDRFEELAGDLGADMEATDVVSAHEAFDAASKRLEAATAATPGLKALALSGIQGAGFSMARPDQNPTLRLFKSLGLNLVEPTSEPGDINTDYNSFFYERNSFELAGKYPADLMLYGNLAAVMPLEALQAVPTWTQLPAVQAGQITPWRILDPFSYRVLSADLDQLAAAVESAKVVN